MDYSEVEQLYIISDRKIREVDTSFHRYLYDQINWNNRLISVKGARGTGKTTMLLQRIKEHFRDSSKALYASLDNLWFANHSLLDLVDDHVSHGGTHIFLDEIHYYDKCLAIGLRMYY